MRRFISAQDDPIFKMQLTHFAAGGLSFLISETRCVQKTMDRALIRLDKGKYEMNSHLHLRNLT